jgi:hypothetical protein
MPNPLPKCESCDRNPCRCPLKVTEEARYWAPQVTDEELSDLLSLVGVEVTPADTTQWTPEQRGEAYHWAASVHLHASDNDDVKVPPRPVFLPVVVTPHC